MNIIRPATIGDLERVIAIIRNAIQSMENKGIFQWNEKYPTKSVLQADIENEHMHVVEDTGVVARFVVINQEEYPGYSDISWTYSGKILAVHRLTIDPEYQGKKLSSRLMDFVERKAVSKGYNAIRLDAFVHNPAAMALYEGRGYEKAGVMQFEKGDFICYESAI